jgi:hypothetical protein
MPELKVDGLVGMIIVLFQNFFHNIFVNSL